MASLLKNLLGNDTKEREIAGELRTILLEMQHERERYETVLQGVRTSIERLQELGDPIAKNASEIEAMTTRLDVVEHRFASVQRVAGQVAALDERTESIAQSQQRAEAQIAGTLENAQSIRATFEELRQKVDHAAELKDQLAKLLEADEPFQDLWTAAEELRGQVEGTTENVSRLREQHDRLVDAHKLAMAKMEAMDRRRDDLGRELQDKERRVSDVDRAVRAMDGVQHTVDDVKREMGRLKAMGDSVIQKTAALEAQRDAVERALAQADNLDRAMRQIDAGVRQQQDNEKSLNALQEQVSALRSLHETVVERSSEVSGIQREADERIRETRQELAAITGEMKKTVDRFDFESRGLESVSQRVADLRGSLTDCETRFKALNEPSLAVGELRSQAKTLAAQMQNLSDQVGTIDQEVERFLAIRRDLDETGRRAREIGEYVTRIEGSRTAIEAGLQDLSQLGGAHAAVTDALEQAERAHDEIRRLREAQTNTQTWLAETEREMAGLREQAARLEQMTPTLEVVEKQAQRLGESLSAIESRREFVDEMHRRVSDLGALGARLEERDRQLHSRMEAAEQRFLGLGGHVEEAERLRTTIAAVTSQVTEAQRKADDIGKAVTAIGARCESVEELGERTRALKPQIEQRQHALEKAAKDLERASQTRQEAAESAQQLEELAQKLGAALATADKRTARVDELCARLEERMAGLRSIEKRLAQFDERLSSWEPVEREISRSLEDISSRQGTIETLQVDLDRMFSVAEKTAGVAREITSAQQELEESRKLLTDVTTQMEEIQSLASDLDERKRQTVKAEHRLARAEALLADVRSSLDTLEGQRAIVDQAVEKAGSLQFLLKQAEATIDGLREEREMAGRVRDAISIARESEGKTKKPKAA